MLLPKAIGVAAFLFIIATATAATTSSTVNRSVARTSFQSFEGFDPVYDIRSDVAMVYGVDDSLTSRIQGYRREGYVTHLMTGSAWGQYEEYIDGRFDGKKHADEGQVDPAGNVIWHHPGVPYMVPTPSFVDYLTSLSKTAIDAGAEALHLEEPEFWSRAGYSEGFKRLYKAEYGKEWQRPDSSPDAFWRSSKLKYLLYKRTLEKVFAAAKEHGRKSGRDIECYVPTHSLINYAQWGIVSPETSLMDLQNCDGYIAQVWTGTARQKNNYRGISRERTFESAYLEYASMHAMTRPTGRRVYFLADPVEDDPSHTWDDYKANYERVLVASLLFPEVSDFEVMPWPNRVFTALYPAGSYAPDAQTTAVTIPSSYAAELMICVNALNEMNQERWKWDAGSDDVAVLVSDTMMFQRGSPWSSDTHFNEFYGLALPLVKHGVPAKCVVLEQVMQPTALEGVSVLLMSYDHMKPLKPDYHDRLAQWVRGGGQLLCYGTDNDRFVEAQEWWNADPKQAGSPTLDLMKRIGISTTSAELVSVGKGSVLWSKEGPASFARAQDGAERVMKHVRSAKEKAGKPLKTANRLVLERGPFTIGALPDEGTSGPPVRLAGYFVDLFTSSAMVRQDPEFKQGEVFLLRKVPAAAASFEALAGSARIEEISRSGNAVRLTLRGPLGTPGVLRFSSRAKPADVSGAKLEWSEESQTGLLSFEMKRGGNDVEVHVRP